MFELVLSIGLDLGGAHSGYVSDRVGDLAFVNIASLVSSLGPPSSSRVGVTQLRRGDREAAYRNFERALLIAIFVTEVFSFVESQFGAVFGLAITLVLLAALRTVRKGPARAAQAAALTPPGLAPAPS